MECWSTGVMEEKKVSDIHRGGAENAEGESLQIEISLLLSLRFFAACANFSGPTPCAERTLPKPYSRVILRSVATKNLLLTFPSWSKEWEKGKADASLRSA